MFLGADADSLEALGLEMKAGADGLTAATAQLSAALRGSQWAGSDAEAFRADWDGPLAASAQAVVAMLERAAEILRRNAADQRRTSAPDPGSPPAGPPVPPPLPSNRVISARSIDYGLSVGVGDAQFAEGSEILVETLADGTVRVTRITTQEVGHGYDIGARVELEAGEIVDLRTGNMAQIANLGGSQTYSVYEVPASEADELVKALAAQEAMRLGGIGNPLASILPSGLPEPVRQGSDGTYRVEGSAIVGVPGHTLAAEGSVRVANGSFTEGHGDSGVRTAFEAKGELGSNLPTARILGVEDEELKGEVSGFTEVVSGPDGQPKEVRSEIVTGEGDTRTVRTIRVPVTEANLGEALAVRDYVANPLNPGRLAGVDLERLGATGESTEATVKVTEDPFHAGVGASVPGRVGGSVDVEARQRSAEYSYPR